MKIMGIVPYELKKRAQADFGEGTEAEARFKLFDQKRRGLIESIHIKAGEADDMVQHMQMMQSGASFGAASMNSTFSRRLIEMIKESSERQTLASKRVAQRLVVDALEQKWRRQIAIKNDEERLGRLQALKKEIDTKMAASKKEGEKKQEKIREVIDRANRMRNETAQEKAAGYVKNDQRVKEQMLNKARQYEEFKSTRAQAWAERSAHIDSVVNAHVRYRDQKGEELRAKHENNMARMEAQLADKQARTSATMAAKEQSIRENVMAAQVERETRFKEMFATSSDKQKEVHQRRDALLDEKQKAIKKHNLTVFNKHAASWEKVKRDLDESTVDSRRLRTAGNTAASTSPSSPSSPMRQTFGSLSTPEVRAHKAAHRELVDANLTRLQRAHRHDEQTRREKIEMMEQKVQNFSDGRMHAEKMRMNTLKHCAHERNLVRDQVEMAQTWPPEKLLGLVKRMDPEPDVVTKIDAMLKDMGIPLLNPKAADEEETKKK
jgi:hypothetical protein